MKISKEEVNYIAKLAKLEFDDQQAEKLAKEFHTILSHFELIEQVDLDGIDINHYREDAKSVLRKDEPRLFGEKEKLFQNVKTMRDGYIQVPKIIE